MVIQINDGLSLIGQESDGVDLIQFAGLVNFVGEGTFLDFLNATETPREYGYMYYEIHVSNGILYYRYTVDLLIDGVDWVPEYSIPVEQAKKIVEEFELQKKKYNKDPLLYTLDMIKGGAKFIVYEEYKSEIDAGDTSRFMKDVQNSPNGVVRVDTEEEKAELLKKLHS